MTLRRGQTLIEVFFAMLLLSAVFFALASVFPSSLGSIRKATTTATASDLAQQTLETWRQKDWTTLSANPTVPPAVQNLEGIDYTVKVGVHDTNPPHSDLVRQVDVTVTWSSGGTYGDNQVRFSTVVFNTPNHP
ncbi:MAG: type IV pilus modification PilV family protein [Candidatus Xenobia bacterium]